MPASAAVDRRAPRAPWPLTRSRAAMRRAGSCARTIVAWVRPPLRWPRLAPVHNRSRGLSMKVHLIDGTFELFRAYYGAPPSKTADGFDVGAVRGLARSMLALL